MKFYWWLLEAGPDGSVTFEYLRKAQNDITVKGNLYNIQQIIDWNPPYIPGAIKLKVLLKCVCLYLSRGNVSGPLDTWIEATEGNDFGGKELVRTALRRGGDQDTVSLSINKARKIFAGLEYLEEKDNLGLAAARKLDQWSNEYLQADALHNQVVRGTMTKAAALHMLDYLISEN